MRNCPVCNKPDRVLLWSMPFKVPDGWPLPRKIDWYKCRCGMLYGDGDFDQKLLNKYYTHYYGYGVNSAQVDERLSGIAAEIATKNPLYTRVVDFGGSGDDGKSIVVERLKAIGFDSAYNVNAGEPIPTCDILLASHVMEHIYDMEDAMKHIDKALVKNGLLIIDGPDATGLLMKWQMPILDFHTKHINHFRMIDYLKLVDAYGFELVDFLKYLDVRSSQSAQSVRLYFRRMDTARQSMAHVVKSAEERLAKLKEIREPVNVWGLGDISWHLLAQADIEVLDYIDNDPAYRNEKYDGKPVLEKPSNIAPILIMAQGQREKLISNIRAMGVMNRIIEV